MALKKIACLFPGIGYTCDKPLLYYSWKLLKGMGWEVVPVAYTGFPSGVKGDAEKMSHCARMAADQAEEILKDVEWDSFQEILFVGKSIGTVVGCDYALRHQIACRQILFTPVEETFQYVGREAIAFHGTADPWADTKEIEKLCKAKDVPLYETEGANHSLECGDVDRDIETMKSTMRIVREYMEKR